MTAAGHKNKLWRPTPSNSILNYVTLPLSFQLGTLLSSFGAQGNFIPACRERLGKRSHVQTDDCCTWFIFPVYWSCASIYSQARRPPRVVSSKANKLNIRSLHEVYMSNDTVSTRFNLTLKPTPFSRMQKHSGQTSCCLHERDVKQTLG